MLTAGLVMLVLGQMPKIGANCSDNKTYRKNKLMILIIALIFTLLNCMPLVLGMLAVQEYRELTLYARLGD